MAIDNDSKIKELLGKIEEKRKSLGDKPKRNFETTLVLKGCGFDVNLLTLRNKMDLIKVAGQLVSHREMIVRGCEELLVETNIEMFVIGSHQVSAYLRDIEILYKILCWDEEKVKLNHMESKLKDLYSEQARTQDALSDIAKEMGL